MAYQKALDWLLQSNSVQGPCSANGTVGGKSGVRPAQSRYGMCLR